MGNMERWLTVNVMQVVLRIGTQPKSVDPQARQISETVSTSNFWMIKIKPTVTIPKLR
jgi:hypothetical protein